MKIMEKRNRFICNPFDFMHVCMRKEALYLYLVSNAKQCFHNLLSKSRLTY